MYKLSVIRNWWLISKDGEIILSGIGTSSQAALIAKQHGIVLTEFKDLNHLKVA
ncbi:MAG: hypothetical protein IIB77_07105 [Proteobacteria bacterium]|nr:hypothetical protein [Pseudomonadota bacterium]